MIEAATEFRKNGFNDDDAAQLGLIASMYQNVSDEAISAGESASFIIAQLTAFGDSMSGFTTEAEKAEHVIDAVNEVANSFAVSSGQLATNLGNMSAVMAQTGASFEESLGMLTAITEVTRNASKASRGLVSIGSRLVQIVDDSSSTGKALKQIYEELGIQLFDSEGQLRSSYEIFSDLAEIWDTLDTNTQNYIASQQAGTNQFQNFAALMDNFGTATEATATAINSAGSAATENARYMESLNAKTQQVKATFQDLANNVIDSQLVKSLLDLANALLQLLNTPVGTFVTQFTLLSGVLTGVLAIAPNFTKVFSQFSLGIQVLTGATTAATAGLTGLSGALTMAAPVAAAVALAIVGVATAVNAMHNSYLEAHPTVEMLEEDIQELNGELDTNKTRLQELESIPWADRTTAQQLEIDRLKEENEELEKNIKLKNQQKAETWGSELAETPTQYVAFEYAYDPRRAQYTDEIEKLGVYSNREDLVYVIKQNEELAKAFENGTIQIREFNEEISNVDYIKKLSSELENLYNKKVKNTQLTADETERYKELTNILGPYLSELESMNDGTTLQSAGLYDVYTALNDILTPVSELTEKEEILNQGFRLTSEQFNTLISVAPELKEQAIQVGDAFYLSAEAFANCSEASIAFRKQVIQDNIDRLESTIETTSKEIEALIAVQEAYTLAGEIGNQIVFAPGQTPTDKLNEAQNSLTESETELERLKELLAQLNSISTEEPEVNSTSSITKEKTLIDLLQEELDILDHQAFLIEKNGEDQTKLVEIYKQAQQRIHEIAEEYRKKGYSETSEEIRELQKLWWDYADEIENVNQSILEEQEKAWEEALENQISSLEEQQNAYETAFNYMVSQIDKEIEKLEEQKDIEEEYWDAKIQALQDQNDEIERQIQLEEAQKALAQAESQQMLVFKDGRFQYVQNVQAISDAQTDLESLEREEALRQEVNNLEQLKNQAIASIDAQIENWEKYKEEWSSVVDQYQEEQDRLIAEQVLGIELEGENWQLRLDNLQQYVNEYLSIMNQLTTAQNTLNAGFGGSIGGISSGSGGGGGGGGNVTISHNTGTATIPGFGGDVPVQIVNGHTVTTGLPVGTVVHTNAGDYVITGVTDSGYESEKVGSSSGSSSHSSSSSSSSGGSFHDAVSDLNQQIASGGGNLHFKYASGTLSAHGGLSLVGENGPELRLLNSGDGILPSNITKNLMTLGQFSIKDLIGKMGTIYQYSFDKLVLPNVTDANSLINELKRFKQFVYQQ